jgi:hypothetical protein
MSENLSKLAHKIDFFKDESEGKGKPASEGEKEVIEEKQMAAFMPSLWPWDTVRNHLKFVLLHFFLFIVFLNCIVYCIGQTASVILFFSFFLFFFFFFYFILLFALAVFMAKRMPLP